MFPEPLSRLRRRRRSASVPESGATGLCKILADRVKTAAAARTTAYQSALMGSPDDLFKIAR
jgi:hypothetical protein